MRRWTILALAALLGFMSANRYVWSASAYFLAMLGATILGQSPEQETFFCAGLWGCGVCGFDPGKVLAVGGVSPC